MTSPAAARKAGEAAGLYIYGDECETCASPAGKPCIGFDGTPVRPHAPRRHAAQGAIDVTDVVRLLCGDVPIMSTQEGLFDD